MSLHIPVIAVTALLSATAFVYVPNMTYTAPVLQQVATIISHTEKSEPKSTEVLFVGDIMLGRDVENKMQHEGLPYPFMNVSTTLALADVTIGNFEGVVPEVHVQTPSMGFQFSIRNEYLTALRDVGFDVLSLANNHSYDHGTSAHEYTQSICTALSLICGGLPNTLSSSSITVKTVGDLRIGIIFLNTTWGEPDKEKLTTFLNELATISDVQIAFVHWGDEYVRTHNVAQQVLAELMIDHGIDAVVGHHPHVVQDIALYKEKPIFYSLGNFIFDQYFSNDVQEGLGVRMRITGDDITYTLVPFSSKESRNQPMKMTEEGARVLFERILQGVSTTPGVDMSYGVLSL